MLIYRYAESQHDKISLAWSNISCNVMENRFGVFLSDDCMILY